MVSHCSERSIRAPPRLSSAFLGLPSRQCQCLSGWTQIVSDLGGWNVGRFLCPLLFPSGDQYCDAPAVQFTNFPNHCDALAVQFTKFPNPPSKHLCSAKLQTRCGVYCACQSICRFISTDSDMHRAVDSHRETFLAKDCAWLFDASRGSPFQDSALATGSLSL